MTQRLHLVFGGELTDPQVNVFRDVSKIHIVGMFPNYETAFQAWKAEAKDEFKAIAPPVGEITVDVIDFLEAPAIVDPFS